MEITPEMSLLGLRCFDLFETILKVLDGNTFAVLDSDVSLCHRDCTWRSNWPMPADSNYNLAS